MPDLPTPEYPKQHGCEDCRHACHTAPRGDYTVPSPLVPARTPSDPSAPAGSWTDSFYVCTRCDAIWAVSRNPKDMVNEQTPTPAGMKSALKRDATLDDLMPALFAWAPVDEMTERALWQIDYEPQDLFDRLVTAWRHPDCKVARQADILRQLARLVAPYNPLHTRRQKQRGWLLETFRGFEAELDELEPTVAAPTGAWAPFARYAVDDFATLNKARTRHGVLRGVAPPVPPAPKNPPAPETPPARFYKTETGNQPPDEPPLFDLVRQGLRHPWSFLPGIVFGWLIVERAASQVAPDNRAIAVGFLFLVALVFPGAVVASNSAVTALPWWKVFGRRLSAVADYALAGVLLAIPVVAVPALASLAGVGDFLKQPAPFAAFAAAVVLLVLTRIWPFFVVPYMQAPEADLQDPRSPGAWRHQSIWTAWKLTRTPGTFRRYTLPWMLAFIASIAATVTASHFGGTVARSLLLYPVVLPVMTAFTWALVAHLSAADHRARSR